MRDDFETAASGEWKGKSELRVGDRRVATWNPEREGGGGEKRVAGRSQ